MNKIPPICLAALLLAPGAPSAPIAQTPMPDVLVCSGNEPFWNLHLEDAEARFSRLGAPAGEVTLAGGSRSLDFAGVLVWRGAGGGSRPGDLVAFVHRQNCLDTMADEDEGGGSWPYSVVISLADGTVLLGCCRQPEDHRDRKHPTGRNRR